MKIQQNVSLKSYNTFGIDAVADAFARFQTIDELEDILTVYEKNTKTFLSPLILGGGSNILFTRDVKRLVLKNDITGIAIEGEDERHVYLKVGAGELWQTFVAYCIANNLAGVENLSLIPGNVGASPMQNIGAYGVELKDVFHSLNAYHIKDRVEVQFSASDCKFGYRESVFKNVFKNQFVINTVSFRLDKFPVYNTNYGAIELELEKMGVKELSIKGISNAVINIRRSKLPDPKIIGNAGSFFKNPEIPNEQFQQLVNKFKSIIGYPQANGLIKLAAGWLIEQCGWKGYRRGDAGCHERQALVLVNYGNALGTDILKLSEDIVDSVLTKFGVKLEREVNIL